MWLVVDGVAVVGNVGEDVVWRKGGRRLIERVVGEVLARIGANCGLNGVEDDDDEIGEFETVEAEGEVRSVVLRRIGLLGRGERVGIVVAEGGGMAWMVAEERAVCRLFWVCGLVLYKI